jgi:hypothetical protein
VPPGSKPTSEETFTISGWLSRSRSTSAAISEVRSEDVPGVASS